MTSQNTQNKLRDKIRHAFEMEKTKEEKEARALAWTGPFTGLAGGSIMIRDKPTITHRGRLTFFHDYTFRRESEDSYWMILE